MPLDERPLSVAERAEWGRRQRELERQLPKARLWRRAAITLTENLLDALKTDLIHPQEGEIYQTEGDLFRLRRVDGAELVAEYHWWRKHHPSSTEAMVEAAQAWELAGRRALEIHVDMIAGAHA